MHVISVPFLNTHFLKKQNSPWKVKWRNFAYFIVLWCPSLFAWPPLGPLTLKILAPPLSGRLSIHAGETNLVQYQPTTDKLLRRYWNDMRKILFYCVATQKVCKGTQRYCVPSQSLRSLANPKFCVPSQSFRVPSQSYCVPSQSFPFPRKVLRSLAKFCVRSQSFCVPSQSFLRPLAIIAWPRNRCPKSRTNKIKLYFCYPELLARERKVIARERKHCVTSQMKKIISHVISYHRKLQPSTNKISLL